MKSSIAVCLLLGSCVGLAAQQNAQTPIHASATASAMAPTAGEDAVALDRIWQHSVSKYDAARTQQLEKVDRVIASGPYRGDWPTLDKYQVPQWYKDAKFGIFVHWGVYSVPAFGDEWYPRRSYEQGGKVYEHHVATYGPQDKFGYKDLIPRFRAEHYDPNAWAQLFSDAGAKYVIPVFEHHDGFAMYNSSLSDWTIVKMGPHRDVYAELEKALHERGIRMGASFHRAEHDWFYAPGRKFSSDVNDPAYASLYGPAHPRIVAPENDHNLIEDWTYVSPAYCRDWLARATEIVTKYHPDIMWFDWWAGEPQFRPYLAQFAAYYYDESASRGSIGVINYKDHSMETGSAVLDVERGQMSDIHPYTWQTDTSVSNVSWGFIEGDTYKDPQMLIHQLIDIVSKNGNLLLNIGPREDGTIPEPIQHVLLEMGAWLKVNGEAIYGTHAWRKYGEGPTKVAAGAFHDTDTQAYTAQDFRFTAKGNSLYALELGWPAGREVLIHSLGPDALKVRSVALLGSNDKIQFKQEQDGLHLHLPASHTGKYAFVYRIEPEGNVMGNMATSAGN